MTDVLSQFVDLGSDDALLKSLSDNPQYTEGEGLEKALKKEGLVQVQVQVQGKHGTYSRMQWKRASDVKDGEKVVGGQNTLGPSTGSKDNSKQKAEMMLNNCDVGDTLGDGDSKISVGKKKNPNSGDWEMTYTLKSTGKNLSYGEAVKVLSRSQSTASSAPVPDSPNKAAPVEKKPTQFKQPKPSKDNSKQKAEMMLNNCDVGDTLGEGNNKISVGRKKNPNNGDWEMTYTLKSTGKNLSYAEAVKVLSQEQSTPSVNAASTSNNNKLQGKKDTNNNSNGISLSMPSHGDAKKAINDLLASGKSRDDLMSAAKSQGITWKENDNAGINWMRASMAIQKHMKGGK